MDCEAVHRVVVGVQPPARRAAPLRGHGVHQRPEPRRTRPLVEAEQNTQLMIDRPRGVRRTERRLACDRIHRPRRRRIPTAIQPLRNRCLTQQLHKLAHVGPFSPLPRRPAVVQEPEPPQQVVGVAAQCRRRAVRDGQLTEITRRPRMLNVREHHAPRHSLLELNDSAQYDTRHRHTLSSPYRSRQSAPEEFSQLVKGWATVEVWRRHEWSRSRFSSARLSATADLMRWRAMGASRFRAPGVRSSTVLVRVVPLPVGRSV